MVGGTRHRYVACARVHADQIGIVIATMDHMLFVVFGQQMGWRDMEYFLKIGD